MCLRFIYFVKSVSFCQRIVIMQDGREKIREQNPYFRFLKYNNNNMLSPSSRRFIIFFVNRSRTNRKIEKQNGYRKTNRGRNTINSIRIVLFGLQLLRME